VVGTEGVGRSAPDGDILFMNRGAPVRIDWERETATAGEAIHRPRRGEAYDTALEIYDRYVCLKGRDNEGDLYHEPLIAVWDRETLRRIPVPETNRWTVDGDVLYGYNQHRLTAYDLAERKIFWRSETIRDICRLALPMGDRVLLLTQDERWGKDEVREPSYLRVYDRETGEEIHTFRIAKRWMHRIDHVPGHLMLWDITFLYSIRAPGAGSVEKPVVVGVAPRDADALAGPRLARNLETPPEVRPVDLAAEPCIDADLSEWAGVAPRSLEGVTDWKPDFVSESVEKSRFCPGRNDLSARLWFGCWRDSYFVAIEVEDDLHVAPLRRDLWRSDSVSLLQTPGHGAEVEPVVLTIGFAGGEPRFEFGTPVNGFAFSDAQGNLPAPLPGMRQETMALPAGFAGNRTPVSASVRFAAWRDETSRTTTYEIAIPKNLWPIESGVYWDVVVNENDGAGREGGLQIASSLWGIEETGAGGVMCETESEDMD
jgi:hypothetical protein